MKLFVVALFAILGCLNAQDPGVGIAITQKVVTAMKDASLNFLVQEIEAFQIPDFSAKGIKFSNIHVSSPGLTVDNTVANLEEGYIQFGCENFEMVIEGHADIHVLFFSLSNGFKLTASGNDISVNIVPIMTNTIHFQASDPVATIGNINFEITGFMGGLDTAIINLFDGDITNELNQQLSKMLQESIVNALEAINMANPNQLPVGDHDDREPLAINYTWVDTPSVHPGYITGGLNGTVYLRNNTDAEMPFQDTVTLPEIDDSSAAGLQLFYSEYVIQTFLYDLQAEDFFRLNITDNILPKNSTISMNTNSLNYIFPGLEKKFGNDQPCYMYCYADNTTYPHAEFIEGGAGANLTTLCSLYATYASTGQWGLACTFRTTVVTLGDVFCNSTDNTLSMNVSSLAITGTTVVTNNIGFLTPSLLQAELNLVLTGFKSIFNTILNKESIPLPKIPQADITNASITLHNGYAEITGEPVFHTISVPTPNPDNSNSERYWSGESSMMSGEFSSWFDGSSSSDSQNEGPSSISVSTGSTAGISSTSGESSSMSSSSESSDSDYFLA